MPWPVSMTLIFAAAALPFFIYVILQFTSAVSMVSIVSRWHLRLLGFTALLALYTLPLMYLFYYWLGKIRSLFIFSDQLQLQDYLFHYPFWWGLIVLLEVVPFYLAIDLIGIVNRYKTFIQRPVWLQGQAWIKIGLMILVMCYVAVRIYIDTQQVRLKNYPVSIKNLPPELEGLKITLLGDIQVDRYTGDVKLSRMESRVRQSDPDILLFAGDLVTSGKMHVNKAVQTICGLQARLNRFACMGDHDFWSDPVNIEDGQRTCGWEFLQNKHEVVAFRGKRILITGITHIYSQRISGPTLEKLLQDAPEADLKILLVHQPAEFLVKAAAEHGYHLLAAGHTHGGQIVNHVFGIPLALSRIETDYYHGQYRNGGMNVIVTTGVGLTLAPVRYHAAAEVAQIVLTAE